MPPPLSAQATEAAAGATLGTLAGAVVTVATLTASARAGRFLHSPSQASWELAPIPILAVAGGVLGYNEPDRLWRGVGWGAGGLVAGAAVGVLAGRTLWGDSEGTWSGAVLGGAAGMVAGALLGALTWDGDEPAPFRAQMSVPIGP